jgi:dihydroorotate dehydrogenase (fumarate)
MSPVDLSTTWMGLPLASPLVVGACGPLSADPDRIPLLAEQGAAAVVLHSLFLEQVERDWQEWQHHQLQGSESYAESLSYQPPVDPSHLGLEGYLHDIETARRRVDIPIMASLNGVHPGHWQEAARAIEQAGASALELNLYAVPTDTSLSAAAIEAEQEEIVRSVCGAVALPVAVKLSPYYTNLTSMAQRFQAAGAQGLVLFNRFHQPDIDIDTLSICADRLLSSPADLRPPLRWIALLEGRVPVNFAASGGIDTATDVVRLLMVGARITQVVSCLLRHGPAHLRRLETDLRTWLEEHDHGSLRQLQGCMGQRRCPDPQEYERAQYIRALGSYTPSAWPESRQALRATTRQQP